MNDADGERPEPIDVDELMQDIRRRVADKKARGLYSVDALAADAIDDIEPVGADELERLRALAVQHVDLAATPSNAPYVGPAVSFVKRRLTRGVSQPMLSMAEQSSQFNAAMLSYSARLGQETASLREDADGLAEALEEARARVSELEGEVDRLNTNNVELAERVARIESLAVAPRLSRLEGGDAPANRVEAPGAANAQGVLGVMLEGRDLDAADAERWTRILMDAPSPVLHVGAGSGRALTGDLEQVAGVEADAELAALAQREGRDVVGADPRSYVASLPENGIGCALVTGLTEELEGRELNELVTGLARALRPDGLLVLDALDPRDPGALGELWRDPRRSRLLHPDAAMAVVDSAGFTGAVVSEVEGSTPRRYEVHARA